MADLKNRWIKRVGCVDLGTDEARAAYQEQRLTLELGRTIRHWRKEAN